MAVLKSRGPNGWHFGWSFLRSALANIAELATLLQELHKSRNNPVERQRSALLAGRCRDHQAHMAAYGHDWPDVVKINLR